MILSFLVFYIFTYLTLAIFNFLKTLRKQLKNFFSSLKNCETVFCFRFYLIIKEILVNYCVLTKLFVLISLRNFMCNPQIYSL